MRQPGSTPAPTSKDRPPIAKRWPTCSPSVPSPARSPADFAANRHHCAQCHGASMQGISGPALAGPSFSGPDNNLSVSDVYGFLSTQMPAGAPGSLTQKQYVEIMAW
ncbi:MAG: c-type cytochrome [Vulcanimicrobiaceae bacterium]